MTGLKFLFFIIAICAIGMFIYFSGKKKKISHKLYWLRQSGLIVLALISFIMMFVVSSISFTKNNDSLTQVSATNKKNIVDKEGNISYVYRTGPKAKVLAEADTSSVKVNKINSTDYRINVHLKKDNYDYLTIYSQLNGVNSEDSKHTIYNKNGLKEKQKDDYKDQVESLNEVAKASNNVNNNKSDKNHLKKVNEKNNLNNYKNDIKKLPKATQGALKNVYVDENGSEQTVAVLSSDASMADRDGLKSIAKTAYDTINSYVQTYNPFPDGSLAYMIRIEDSSGNVVAKTSWGQFKFVG